MAEQAKPGFLFAPAHWRFSQWLAAYLKQYHPDEQQFEAPSLAAELDKEGILPVRFSGYDRQDDMRRSGLVRRTGDALKELGYTAHPRLLTLVAGDGTDAAAPPAGGPVAGPSEPARAERTVYLQLRLLSDDEMAALLRDRMQLGPWADIQALLRLGDEWKAARTAAGHTTSLDIKATIRQIADELLQEGLA